MKTIKSMLGMALLLVILIFGVVWMDMALAGSWEDQQVVQRQKEQNTLLHQQVQAQRAQASALQRQTFILQQQEYRMRRAESSAVYNNAGHTLGTALGMGIRSWRDKRRARKAAERLSQAADSDFDHTVTRTLWLEGKRCYTNGKSIWGCE